jgi:hypothetical protein
MSRRIDVKIHADTSDLENAFKTFDLEWARIVGAALTAHRVQTARALDLMLYPCRGGSTLEFRSMVECRWLRRLARRA